jgi:hypothetical protein
MQTSVAAYIDAFKRHYPNHDVKVKYRSRNDSYAVFINGDHGGILLSHEDLVEATRMFNR